MQGRIKQFVNAIPIPDFNYSNRVGFIVCGTQKGGTTALDQYLRKHPDICMADKKEVHFFDKKKNFPLGIGNYRKYHQFFSPQPQTKIIGEATPVYMYKPKCVERMAKYNPDLKLIVVLRCPIQRAYSHWNMLIKSGAETLGFGEAMRKENERVDLNNERKHPLYSYVDRGLYSNQIKRLWQHFPKEHVLVLKNESLKLNPMKELDKVCEFLDVSNMPQVDNVTVFSHSYEEKIQREDVEVLKGIFQQDVSELEQLLKWDCSDWLTC